MKKNRPWRLRTTTIKPVMIPALMGVVNVTPDSFSDGGRYLDPGKAVAHALQLVEDGADILDIGGQSTRPGSKSVTAAEELHRVLPVIQGIRRETDLPISIDTDKVNVAKAALDAGVEIVNDITGLRKPGMVRLVAKAGCGVCVMHMRETPRTMQDDPRYENVVVEVTDFLADRLADLLDAGIDQARIAVDPGIGFGKTITHNLQILGGIHHLRRLGCPVLVGHSRKRFIGEVIAQSRLGAHAFDPRPGGDGGDPRDKSSSTLPTKRPGRKQAIESPADRIAGTIGASVALAAQGVEIIRVHDVRQVREALLIVAAIRKHQNRRCF